MCMPTVLACLSKPERTYFSLTPQLDTVIIEESSVMIKNVDTSVTTPNFILTCSSGVLYNN